MNRGNDMKTSQRLSQISPNFIALLLLCVFFMLSFFSVLGQSPTYDEARNYNYGKSILNGNSNRPGDVSILDGVRIDGSMMAASALNGIPSKIATVLPQSGFRSLLESIFVARLVTILFSLLAAWLIHHWTRSLYGTIPAFFALLLYIFDPNIIAHSQLVTTDMYAWGSTLLVFFCSWKFANHRSTQNGLLWAAALGISSLAKYTTVILIPLSLLTILIHDLPEIIKKYKEHAVSTIREYSGKYTVYLLGSIAVSILMINIGFLFNKTFMPFGEYEFSSRLLGGIQSGLPVLNNLPVPVPFPYLEGFDLTYYYGEEGLAFGNIYLLGELRDGKEGFKGYYFIASFFKVPIATQLIMLFTFYVYMANSKRRQRFFSDEVFLLLPILFFTIYFNFLFSIHIGIRYYLVLFPLLYVFCGSLFTAWSEFSKPQKTAGALLLAHLVLSTLSYFPNYMPYFNEFLWDKRQAYKILADSNIDYGQSEGALNAYLASHPTAIHNPAGPVSGTIVIGVNDLVGVFGKPDQYAWLRENFEPQDTIARTHLVYHISAEDLQTICQTTEYCR
jgi:hypothetical protein